MAGNILFSKPHLVTSRAALKQLKIQEKRNSVREQVTTISKRRGGTLISPLLVFPEEIWLLILERLNGDEDTLLNFYSSCAFFMKMFATEREMILFQKVLPIVYQKTNYLLSRDLLPCRLTSPQMCQILDNFLENDESRSSMTSQEPHLFERTHPPILYDIRQQVKPKMVSHSRNPFLGRSIQTVITATHEDREIGARLVAEALRSNPAQLHAIQQQVGRNFEFGLAVAGVVILRDQVLQEPVLAPVMGAAYLGPIEELNVIEDAPNNPGNPETNDFDKYASHVWHLNLFWGDLPIHETPSARRVSGILAKFKNLRRLGIENFMGLDAGPALNVSAIDMPNLTSLRITTPANVWHSNGDRFYAALVKKFSGQLKELEVTKWNHMEYHAHNWGELKTLKVDKCIPLTLHGISQMTAPNLSKLSLHLNSQTKGNSVPDIMTLLQIVNRFKKLEDLVLHFNAEWEFSEESLQTLSGLENICSTALKRLHVRTGFEDKITYSFVACFPFLEHLHISYGCPGLDLQRNYDDTLWFGNSPKEVLYNRMYFEKMFKREGAECTKTEEIVELRDYIYIKQEDIHKSVVWEILPFLRDIQITQFWRTEDVIANNSRNKKSFLFLRA